MSDSPRPAEQTRLRELAATEPREETAENTPEANDSTPPRISRPAEPSPLDRVERILRLLSIIGITLSAILASWQYLEAQSREARSRALVHITDWQSGPAKPAFIRLQRALEPLVAAIGPLPAGADAAARARARQQVGNLLLARLLDAPTSPGYADLPQADDLLVDFYARIEFCIDARLCEEALLRAHFAADVRAFWAYLAPYAAHQRRTYYPHYADAVERLAERFR